MKKPSKLSGAAWPTAFVAGATRAMGRGAGRKRRGRGLPLGGRLNAVQKRTRRRRRSSSRHLAMVLVRHAGTIVSGAAVAADLASQINSVRQSGEHEQGHGHSPNGKRPARSAAQTSSSTHSSNGSNGHAPTRAKRGAPSKSVSSSKSAVPSRSVSPSKSASPSKRAAPSKRAVPSKSAAARKRQSSAVGQKGAR